MSIPTKELLLPHTKVKVLLNQWITQSQANKYQELIMGENLFELDGGEQKMKMAIKDLNAGNKFLIESLLAEMTYEDYDNLHPKDRKAIEEEAVNIKEANEKK